MTRNSSIGTWCCPRTLPSVCPRPIWCQRLSGGTLASSRVKAGYTTWSINQSPTSCCSVVHCLQPDLSDRGWERTHREDDKRVAGDGWTQLSWMDKDYFVNTASYTLQLSQSRAPTHCLTHCKAFHISSGPAWNPFIFFSICTSLIMLSMCASGKKRNICGGSNTFSLF